MAVKKIHFKASLGKRSENTFNKIRKNFVVVKKISAKIGRRKFLLLSGDEFEARFPANDFCLDWSW